MKLKLDVQPDHLEEVAKTRPLLGLAELIWNAVDADAQTVRVNFNRNFADGIEGMTVQDDGHGITHDEAKRSFGKLGGSWKKAKRFSQRENRALHGQEGKGRFKAFCIGNIIQWRSVYRDKDGFHKLRIIGRRPELDEFEVTDPNATDEIKAGTVVEINDVRDGIDSLSDPEKVAAELAGRLAIYLRKYPSVRIYIEDVLVDPSRVESHTAEYRLPNITLTDGQTFPAKLSIIEWSVPTERALFFCDESGFAKNETNPGIKAKGWQFTAFLSSKAVDVLEERGAFELKELSQDYTNLTDLAKRQMRTHFTQRDAETASSVVEGWKRDGVYPYGGEPKDLLEQTERQVFDVVAMQLAEALPDFDESDTKSKRLSMRLLKQAIEKSPEEVQQIFGEVLGLSQEKQADLAELLKHTSLSSIISAAKLVACRLEFIRGLEMLLFDPVSHEQLKERTQLHKILEDYTWLWGEEFALSASDQSLNDVLAAHLGLLGKRCDDDSTVRREDGSRGIVDLMLSRLIPQTRSEEREHLIVELKRPSVSIDRNIISQAQSYADAVADDPRFKDTKTRWSFWLVSNSMSLSGCKQSSQADRPRGLCYKSENGCILVWAKTWGEIIQANKARLEFLQKRLEYKVSDQSAIELLRKMHAKYLPPVFLKPDESGFQDTDSPSEHSADSVGSGESSRDVTSEPDSGHETSGEPVDKSDGDQP